MAVLLALRSLLIWKAKWAFVQQQIFFSYGYEKKNMASLKTYCQIELACKLSHDIDAMMCSLFTVH